MDDAPKYEALSYAWGRPDGSVNIDINGRGFVITPNLHEALEQLQDCPERGQEATRTIWVDAICINQKDDGEKSCQVMVMGNIYARASQVLVWLGKSNDLTEIAFDTLTRFAANDGTEDARLIRRSLQDSMAERRVALQRFLLCPYFERSWVIQEVVSARTAVVVCGESRISFDDLHRGLYRATGSGYFPFSRYTAQISNIGIWRECFLAKDSSERDEALDIRILLMDSRDKKCGNILDKVYSLRGIGSTSFASGIKVDYGKDTASVYIDCAKHLLRTRPDLRVLSSVQPKHHTRTSEAMQLPSWVPDWSQEKCPAGVFQRYYRFSPKGFFRAAGNTKPVVTVSDDSDIAHLAGRRIGSVTSIIRIKDFLDNDNESPGSLTWLRLEKLAAEMGLSERYALTGEEVWKALFRTLTADRSGVSFRLNDEYKARYLSSFDDYTIETSQSSQDLSEEFWNEVSKLIEPIIGEMDMFGTDSGHLGLGHKGFHVGDLVCILFGGEVPFLLRPVTPPSDLELYQLLTECYLHGVMDGEALADTGEYARETFSVC